VERLSAQSGFSTRFSRSEYDGCMLLKIAAATDSDG
jgi:hypothetical protein